MDTDRRGSDAGSPQDLPTGMVLVRSQVVCVIPVGTYNTTGVHEQVHALCQHGLFKPVLLHAWAHPEIACPLTVESSLCAEYDAMHNQT